MKFFLLIFFLFGTLISKAQSNVVQQDVNFAFQVKQVDEFFDRFNLDTLKHNFLEDFLKANGFANRDTFDRAYFIKTLFNVTDSLNSRLANEFINEVTNAEKPIYIDFYDDNWYALLECEFQFASKPVKINLVLKNQVKENRTSKWIIQSVTSPIFKQKPALDSTKIMAPMSHAVDFMNLEKSLSDKKNLENYFKKDFDADELSEFYFLINNGLLSFKRMISIKYYFLQIPNWQLEVNYFTKVGINSGWLISQFRKMNSVEKMEFKKDNLNIF